MGKTEHNDVSFELRVYWCEEFYDVETLKLFFDVRVDRK